MAGNQENAVTRAQVALKDAMSALSRADRHDKVAAQREVDRRRDAFNAAYVAYAENMADGGYTPKSIHYWGGV